MYRIQTVQARMAEQSSDPTPTECSSSMPSSPSLIPIPDNGPVGAMLRMLGRHPNRPGHVHFMIQALGYDKLTTYVKD